MMRHLLVTSAVYLAVYCLAALPATTCAQAPGGAQTSAATAEKPGEVNLPGGGTATPAEDRDRDGFSDAEEALAGTDPKIPDSPAVFAWAEAVAKLRRIGAALERYSLAHKDAPRSMPPDLTTLVREGLLEAQMLTCHCDPYHGEQGGIPDSPQTQAK